MSSEKCFSTEDAARLGKAWSEKEVRRAIAELAKNKSPGVDGLPKELLELHWDLLGGQIMGLINGFTRTTELSAEVTMAVTIQLHKKGPLDKLQNYRPISLLNTSYKVIAKVMVNMLKMRLHKVISEGHHDFLPRRHLADAVALVADAIDTAKNGSENWLLLLVDFQKAYDTIARPYLFAVLQRMGFPKIYVRWVEGLPRDATMRVCTNGWLGERVAVQVGVRQGCPLAPYLFLCAMEPLCQEVKRRHLGIGEKRAGRLAYLGYADDTKLLLRGKHLLEQTVGVLQEFGQISGLRTNYDN
ncbi:hypothetical protein CLOM_g13293 [Closterium sp. NIES-68]|nr:hypothetical protein CLOM_g13293 [Closterium sp. NIES-68]GJP82976.1 hypothetical protein CLOP_g13189 [Closterium sp. NIES-67]